MKTAEPIVENRELSRKAKWVVSTQLVISVLVAVVFLFQGPWEAVAAVYGGLVSVCVSLLLLRGIQHASAIATANPGKSMSALYIGAVQRFLVVLVLVGVGILVFKLNPVGVCVGFAIAQFAYLAGSRDKPSQKQTRVSGGQEV